MNKLAVQKMWCLLAFILLLVPALYFAKAFLLPIILSAFISLLCGPLVNYLVRLGLPRMLNVMVVLAGFIGAAILVVSVLSEPAQQWLSKLPALAENVSDEVSKAAENVSKQTDSSSAVSQVANLSLPDTTIFSLFKTLLSTAPSVVTQLLIALFMAYFMMCYGRSFFVRVLMQLEGFHSQRRAVELVRQIQQDLSVYIGAITLVNIALGVSVGSVFYLMGLQDAFLWGAFAGFMNFIPYLGPMVSVVCFTLVSYLEFESLSFALTIASTFLAINLAESQLVTPTVLGRRFSLNPLVLFIWLVFWGWLWGAMGMLVGVPLLVCINVILERLDYFGESYLMLRTE
ncbi:AI-2E family transporter [Marinomonas sp.]